MEGSGGGDAPAEGDGGGFQWDADSQLYYHASTGFYHDPVAGWYYNSRDGQYYIYENGNYKPLMTDLGNKPTSNDEAILESSCLVAGLEPAIPDDENEILGPPSEWMEETLINLYLSGYSNREVNAESSLGNTHTNEEDRTETTGNKPSALASDSASDSLNDATSHQVEDEMETKNSTAEDDRLGEEEEKWLAQYGQVERVDDDQPLLRTIDIWDWCLVQDRDSKDQPVAKLVGCLSRGSSKLHPSLPARGGRLRTACVSEVHLDLVRVSTGKVYRLRNPSRKYLASLSAYDSSNPTKDWGFPDICANPDIILNKQSSASIESTITSTQNQSEIADETSIEGGVSAANGKEQKTKSYRDRAAERRNLHRGLGIGPGQKQSSFISFDEYEESIDDIDSMGTAPVDMNFRSSGLHSAKRIMENMGWKEGEALGKSRKGIVEPIQPIINKYGAGLGWNQTR